MNDFLKDVMQNLNEVSDSIKHHQDLMEIVKGCKKENLTRSELADLIKSKMGFPDVDYDSFFQLKHMYKGVTDGKPRSSLIISKHIALRIKVLFSKGEEIMIDLANYFMPDIARELCKKHPNLKLNLLESYLENIIFDEEVKTKPVIKTYDKRGIYKFYRELTVYVKKTLHRQRAVVFYDKNERTLPNSEVKHFSFTGESIDSTTANNIARGNSEKSDNKTPRSSSLINVCNEHKRFSFSHFAYGILKGKLSFKKTTRSFKKLTNRRVVKF